MLSSESLADIGNEDWRSENINFQKLTKLKSTYAVTIVSWKKKTRQKMNS